MSLTVACLPYMSVTGSRPLCALIALVIATSSILQVASGFDCNHVYKVFQNKPQSY